jgi:hypothetical protein
MQPVAKTIQRGMTESLAAELGGIWKEAVMESSEVD